MKFLFPSRSGYCFWEVEGDAGVEVVKEFVNFLDLIVSRSYVSKASEGYRRRQRHAFRLGRRCLPGEVGRG